VLKRVVSLDATAGTVTVRNDDGEIEQLKREQVHPFDESHSQELQDVARYPIASTGVASTVICDTCTCFCRVNNLHEAPLLSMLTHRYEADKIYTFAANVCLGNSTSSPFLTLHLRF
jgi:hypothetical protein